MEQTSRTNNTRHLETKDPSRPDRTDKKNNQYSTAEAQGSLEARKERKKKNRQYCTAGAPGSLERRRELTNRTDNTLQLEPQDPSRLERNRRKNRRYPTVVALRSLKARKEHTIPDSWTPRTHRFRKRTRKKKKTPESYRPRIP